MAQAPAADRLQQDAEALRAGTFDLLDGDFYAGDPDPTYALMRTHHPVYRDEANGLWGVSRYADIEAIELDPQLWTSVQGSRPQVPGDPSMINQDNPRHAALRRLVVRRFTQRAVQAHADRVRSVVTGLIDAIADRGEADVVRDLAAPLPAQVIGWLLGFPEDRWPALQHWSETTIPAGGGLRYITDAAVTAAGEFGTEVLALAEERRRCPAEDLITTWTRAELDGSRFDDAQLCSEALLLLDGGAETTRTVIANTVDALIRHPDQLARLQQHPELLPTAVEEFIRWTTPILNMRRTATRDTELAGAHVHEGDQVLLMYSSANRDETVFAHPGAFDVGRAPNQHLAFGVGTHFCLGASLARLELRIMFEELLRRLDRFAYADEVGPRRVPNAFVRGITSFPVTFERRRSR